MRQDLRMHHALSRWVPVQQMAMWPRRQWKAAGWAYLVALLLMGVAGETLPGASAGRVVPVQWWNYVTLALSPPLMALIVATFVPDGQSRRSRRRGMAGTGAGVSPARWRWHARCAIRWRFLSSARLACCRSWRRTAA